MTVALDNVPTVTSPGPPVDVDFDVSFEDCTGSFGFDYKLVADACHPGDVAPPHQGLYNVNGTCGIPPFDSGGDTMDSNDAPTSLNVNDSST